VAYENLLFEVRDGVAVGTHIPGPPAEQPAALGLSTSPADRPPGRRSGYEQYTRASPAGGRHPGGEVLR